MVCHGGTEFRNMDFDSFDSRMCDEQSPSDRFRQGFEGAKFLGFRDAQYVFRQNVITDGVIEPVIQMAPNVGELASDGEKKLLSQASLFVTEAVVAIDLQALD